MSPIIKSVVLVVFFGLFTSCSKSIVAARSERLPKKKDVVLKTVLDSLSVIEFDYFYTKMSTKYSDSVQNASFKNSIRIVHDSAISSVITFARIPILSAIVTHDSIRVINKRKKCYVQNSLDFFKKEFDVEFNYKNFEELFFGMPIAYSAEKKYFRVNDPFSYTVCSHRKRDIKRNERKNEMEIIMFYTLTDDLRHLKSMRIESPSKDAFINIDYISRGNVGGYFVPKEVDINIESTNQTIKVNLNYRKTRVNSREQIQFVIPENYVKCE
jgi:hypothetical protein